MLLLYVGSHASAKAFSIECTILNFLTSAFVLVSLLVFALKFSGIPYKSPVYKIKIKKLTIVMFIWCLSRLCRGIWGAFEMRFYHWILYSLTKGKTDTMFIPMITIVLFVIVEVIPIMIV
jgi:MFS superfamily sulfate permease-like transporter